MSRERIPDCNGSALTGMNTTVGTQIQQAQITPPVEEKQALFSIKNSTKNKFGHDKNNFRKPRFLTESRNIDKLPLTLEQGMEKSRITGACLAQSKRNLFAYSQSYGSQHNVPFAVKSVIDLFENKEFGEQFLHRPKLIGKNRARVRSESIEATESLIKPTLFGRCDVSTMAFGYRNKQGKTSYYDLGYIQRETGLSASATRRHMARLQRQGLVTLKTIKEKTSLGYRTKRTEIRLTWKLFELYGLADQLKKDQLYKRHIDHERKAIEVKKEVKKEKKEAYSKAKELPGYDRKREKPELYRDYTGISENRMAILNANGHRESHQALSFITDLSNKLKPPS